MDVLLESCVSAPLRSFGIRPVDARVVTVAFKLADCLRNVVIAQVYFNGVLQVFEALL